jgi:hypothetical protein
MKRNSLLPVVIIDNIVIHILSNKEKFAWRTFDAFNIDESKNMWILKHYFV